VKREQVHNQNQRTKEHNLKAKKMKTKQTFYFYFDDRQGKCHLFELVNCISPKRTKVYKELKQAFKEGYITGFAVTTYPNFHI
jgi:hypothetical protein